MEPQHVAWTHALTSRPAFRQFAKWLVPTSEYNFHVVVKPKSGPGRASMFLCVPLEDLNEFYLAYTGLDDYWVFVKECPRGKVPKSLTPLGSALFGRGNS